jgi:hypothetical protein
MSRNVNIVRRRSSGPTFSEQSLDVFSRMNSDPPTSLKVFMDTFINEQVANGNFSKLIAFVPYRIMDTQANSIKDWMGNLSDTTFTNATFTLNQGIRTTGALGSFVDTKFIPSAHATFGQDDAGVGIWMNDNAQTGGAAAIGSLDASSRQILLQQNDASNFTRFRINSSNDATQNVEDIFTDYAMYALERTASNATKMLKDAAQIGSASTAASTGKSTVTTYLGSRNNNGSADLPLAAQFGLFFVYQAVGFDHVGFYESWIKLVASVESGTADDSKFVPLVITAGQSNSVGRGEVNRFLALTPYNTAVRPGVKIFYKSSRSSTADDGDFRPYELGVNSIEPEYEALYNCAGSEVSLCDLMYQRLNRTIYLIKAGEGGTGLYQETGVNDWNVNSTGKSFDFLRFNYFDQAVRKLQIIYPNREIRPIFPWHQGEHDQNSQTNIDAFPTNLLDLMTGWRAHSPLLTNAPFLIHRLYFNLNAAEAQINSHLEDYCDGDANAYFIEVTVSAPRKMDLPALIKSTYPPSDTDDQHNSYEYHVEAGTVDYNTLVSIGYI